MDYQKLYDNIISKYKNNPELLKGVEYFEIHHIIPKCLGGSNDESNLVSLPVREHIILHILLTKIYPDNLKILFAANCMVLGTGYEREGSRRNSAINTISTKLIAEIREKSKKYLREVGIIVKTSTNEQITIFKAKRAICFDSNFNVIRTYYPVNTCSIDGFYSNSVSRACRNKKDYAGYSWMYEEEFYKNHKDELNIFYENAKNGILPDLDTSYNLLSYSDKLKLRPKPVHTEQSKKKISEKNKGRKKNISPEAKKQAREKAKRTMIKNNTQSGRKRILVESPTGKIYNSLTECGKEFKVDRHTIQNWIKYHPEKGFKFVNN